MSSRVAVVGSGPSGATAARILISSGIKVDMYDVGTDAHFDNIKTKSFLIDGGIIPKKSLFGSVHMYCRRDGMRIVASDNVSFDTSHAKGGLSTVWGATVGAVTERDVNDWPIPFHELSKHLKEVFELMQLSSRVDMIDSIYTVKMHGNDLNFETPQSEFILKKAHVNDSELRKHGVFIGKSKLAVNSNQKSLNSCILCGQCMEGCERGAIFNSWGIVDALLNNPNFRYFDNTLIKSFKEYDQMVDLKLLDLNNDTFRNESYDSIVLAAGCIDSTKIVDASLGWTGHEYSIKDSQKYYFPVWVNKGGGSSSDGTISLAHLYAQAFDSKNNVVQGQLYPGNLLVKKVFLNFFGSFGHLISATVAPFLNRLFIGMAYLSSSVSGTIRIRFTKDNLMFAKGIESELSRNEFKTFIGKLIISRKLTGFSPFFGINLRSKLGHSQHFGGTIPMKVNPIKYESDFLGRPYGCKRVFIVDSTVLTSIPATPTTGLVMANASRIASSIIKILKLHS